MKEFLETYSYPFMGRLAPSFLFPLHFRWFMIGLNVPVLAKCKTDKSGPTKTAPATISALPG
jgi:hypothetical protein